MPAGPSHPHRWWYQKMQSRADVLPVHLPDLCGKDASQYLRANSSTGLVHVC